MKGRGRKGREREREGDRKESERREGWERRIGEIVPTSTAVSKSCPLWLVPSQTPCTLRLGFNSTYKRYTLKSHPASIHDAF